MHLVGECTWRQRQEAAQAESYFPGHCQQSCKEPGEEGGEAGEGGWQESLGKAVFQKRRADSCVEYS